MMKDIWFSGELYFWIVFWLLHFFFSDISTAEFSTYMNFCRSLRFDDKPDYSFLRQLYRNLFHRQGFSYDYVFDWNMLKFVCTLKHYLHYIMQNKVLNLPFWKKWLNSHWLYYFIKFFQPNFLWEGCIYSSHKCRCPGAAHTVLWITVHLYYIVHLMGSGSFRAPAGQQKIKRRSREEKERREMRRQELDPRVQRLVLFPLAPTSRPLTGSAMAQIQPVQHLPHVFLSLVSLTMTGCTLSVSWLFLKRGCDSSVLFFSSGNASPRAGRGAERERRVCLRLHRGAPANASPDLPLRHDQIRITPPQVLFTRWFFTSFS